MKVERLEVGQMAANCYICVKGDSALIIDPGDDADYIERRISDLEVTPVAIVATHGHFDHVMAALELKLAYNIPFIMSSEDKFLTYRMESTAEHFTKVKSLPAPEIDVDLKPGPFSIGAFDFEVIHTPGHTPGSMSLYFEKHSSLFVGDVIFADGYVGRTDFKYARPLALQDSIAKIMELPDETVVYSGHGKETTAREVKEYHNA